MTYRLFMLDVPENVPIAAAARDATELALEKIGPYFVVSAERPVSIDRRSTGARYPVWFSCIGGLEGGRIVQWDQQALRLEAR